MFGADIEFFVKDGSGPKLVCGKIGGTKEEPKKIDNYYSILEDGAAVELNYAPAESLSIFKHTILRSSEVIKSFTGFGVHPSPEVRFKAEEIRDNPQVRIIGCLEDYDAYADNPEIPRPTPDITTFGFYRFAGGHIHFSYDTNKEVPPFVAARFMDYYVTVPLLCWAYTNYGAERARTCIGERRSKFYGLAGLHRPKPYGVEYRVLSNTWAMDSNLMDVVGFGLRKISAVFTKEQIGALNDLYLSIPWEDVRDAISTLNFTKLRNIKNI